MNSYLYIAHLLSEEEELMKVSRYFSQLLSSEQVDYLTRDLSKEYPKHKVIKYEVEIR